MNNLLFLTFTIIWLNVIIMLKKLKMHFFYFIVASIGLFTIIMMFYLKPLEMVLTKWIAYILMILGDWLGLYTVFMKELTLMINTKSGIVAMTLNYECSGVIEILVYTCLIIFFPFPNIRRRLAVVSLGNLYICLCNIIRLLFIIVMVKLLGIKYYHVLHTVFARILFFVFMVILYYEVFTKEQLKKQKVGDLYQWKQS